MSDRAADWQGSWRGKKRAVAVATAAAVLAVAAPILISLWLARQQSMAEQISLADHLASEVLRRTDQTARQVSRSLQELETADAKDPCSSANIARMAHIAVAADQVQAVGYVADNRLVCSSFGRYDPPVDLGPAEFTNAHHAIFRTSVTLPDVPGARFIVVSSQYSGYSAVVHPDLALNVFVNDPNVVMGTFSISQGRAMDTQGKFDTRWFAALGDHDAMDLTTADDVVAIRRSKVADFAAFAAVPALGDAGSLWRFAVVLVPFGALAGIALAIAILYLAKLQLALPAVLRAALKRNEFFVEYQPVMDLQAGRWSGAEALIRWRRPGGERVRPETFIPVAEETGLITQITERALDLVAQDAAGLFKRHPDFRLSVNLSASDLGTDRILGHLRRLALATDAESGHLVVEVTEHGLVKGEAAKTMLHALRAAGFGVAIDDFGTGYSNLSYLRTLQADFLKIDKSFIDTIGTDSVTSQVVSHIIDMARSLNLELVAEGVETEGQFRFLRERGVRYMQGWLFAKPMPLAQLLSELAVADTV